MKHVIELNSGFWSKSPTYTKGKAQRLRPNQKLNLDPECAFLLCEPQPTAVVCGNTISSLMSSI